MSGALRYAQLILESLPGLIAAGKNVAELIENSSETLRKMANIGRDPTREEWDLLNAKIHHLRNELHDIKP